MCQFFPVTKETYESLLNRVAEQLLIEESRKRRTAKLERLVKVHNWLVFRLVDARP